MRKILFLFILSSLPALGCDEAPFDLYKTLSEVQVNQFAPIIKTLVTQEATKELKTHSTEELKYSVVAKYNEEFRVFGFSEKEVLEFVGDKKNERACTPDHIHDDLANRWCHGAVVKVIDETLKANGVNKIISALVSASFFLPKEYLVDLHPSKADLVISDFEMFNLQDAKGGVKGTITIFGDGMVFFNFNKKF
ncbi:MAG: hypothetical protein EHM20_09180 [Alphaproteobacteria bacterium]|nr:MAG: hypothetical protein EHM20_09180 [Alphaproteobacteria bacterium]